VHYQSPEITMDRNRVVPVLGREFAIGWHHQPRLIADSLGNNRVGSMSRRVQVRTNFLGKWLFLTLALLAGSAHAEIIFNGDFSAGNFTQWKKSSEGDVRFWGISAYGRPIQYGGQNSTHVGNGELLSLVSVDGRTVNGIRYPAGPTRGRSPFAAKFVVKSEAGGGIEPQDCDPQTNCDNRRAQIDGEDILGELKLIPHRSERWMSFSYFIPSDFQVGSSGFGPVLMGMKARGSSPLGGFHGLTLEGPGGSWRIYNRWTDVLNPTSWDQLPWWQQMSYDSQSPAAGDSTWTDTRDFPDVAKSRQALASVLKGGWTDWVYHWKHDERGSGNGGSGFFKIWKREGSGPWILVVDIRPKVTTRGGRTFDHGIGFNYPDRYYGGKPGLYMSRNRVWQNTNNLVIYSANFQLGNEKSSFALMSPDGSVPGGSTAPPEAPKVMIN
jgi:hypothetical protein